MTPYRLVFTTCENLDSAKQVAARLVEKKLAGCVNILPAVESIYMWQGKLESTTEIKLIIKTHQDKIPSLIEEVKKVHSYETPEIQVVQVEDGNPDYFNWLNEVTS